MEEQTKETEIRLQDLWTIFKRCWWLMLIVLVAVSVLAYTFLSLTHEDEYTANVSIYVMNTPDKSDGNTNNSFSTTHISMAMYLIKDCLELGKSYDQILQPVMASQNLEGVIAIEDLEKMYTIKKADDAHVLYLSVTSSSAERSRDIVNAFADQTCTYFNKVYDQELLSVVDYAQVPERPSNPISMMMILLIGFVCAVVVFGVYFIKFIMDDKINNADDVEKYLGLSMLGVIPNKHESGRKKSKNGYYYSYSADGGRKRVE
ncbi:MAG: hypothetical protein IJZ80_03290 [Clostridia bacterium]|nr:hypothetical protein [Clostridia bacterium]